jgi:ArsR family transcriptional regulator
VADLGAGEGALTLLLARFCEEVSAVDLSPRMLGTLREAAETAGVGERVRTLDGDLAALPLGDGEMDAVFISQALHHAADPAAALAEAARVLRPGGRLLLLDLLQHEQEWVREQFADLWLGFDPDHLKELLEQCGLCPGVSLRLPGATPDLPVLLITALKPETL